jgi:BTB/POZ domain
MSSTKKQKRLRRRSKSSATPPSFKRFEEEEKRKEASSAANNRANDDACKVSDDDDASWQAAVSRIVELTVGGVHFTTTLATLRSVPDSMLARMFSERFRQCNWARQINGRYFIDRDGAHFRHVLNFLRNGGGLETGRFCVPDDVGACRELIVEAEYYQLPALVELLKLKVGRRRDMIGVGVGGVGGVGDQLVFAPLHYVTIRYMPGATYDGFAIRLEGPLQSELLIELNGGAPVPDKASDADVKNIFGSQIIGWKIRGIFLTKIFNLLARYGWTLATSNGSGGGKEKNFASITAEMYVWSAPAPHDAARESFFEAVDAASSSSANNDKPSIGDSSSSSVAVVTSPQRTRHHHHHHHHHSNAGNGSGDSPRR